MTSVFSLDSSAASPIFGRVATISGRSSDLGKEVTRAMATKKKAAKKKGGKKKAAKK